MQDGALAKRYATALADLAAEMDQLDLAEAELASFQAVLAETTEFHQLLVSPVAASADQHAALGTYLRESGSSRISGNFLKLLIDKGRMSLTEAILDALRLEVAERSGRLTVQVQTPRPLTDEHKQELQATLSESTNKQVALEIREDAGLLGGIVVQIGSQMLDYSVRGRLNRMKEHLKG